MRLGFFWLECCRVGVVGERIFRLRFFDRVGQSNPCPVLSFFKVSRRFQASGGLQKFLRVRLAGLGQLQPQIQVRLENIRLCRHRFAIGGDGCFHVAQSIFHETKIEPSLIIRRITVDQLA